MSYDKKKLCLVLTCNKPYYNERRLKSKKTYDILKDNGFTVVFLYSDPQYKNAEFELKNGNYCLTIPIEEIYDNIPTKILEAFKFFCRYNTKGILKIDDDTSIEDPSIFQEDFTEVDYAGASVGSILPGPRLVNKNTITIEKQILYFGGPFYWLSAKALHHISAVGFKYPWEDASIGHAIGLRHGFFTVRFLSFNDTKQVVWSNETDVNNAL
jgi:hypothetical protein